MGAWAFVFYKRLQKGVQPVIDIGSDVPTGTAPLSYVIVPDSTGRYMVLSTQDQAWSAYDWIIQFASKEWAVSICNELNQIGGIL